MVEGTEVDTFPYIALLYHFLTRI